MFRALRVHHQGQHSNINNNLNFTFSTVCIRTVGISSHYDLHCNNMYKMFLNIFMYKIYDVKFAFVKVVIE